MAGKTQFAQGRLTYAAAAVMIVIVAGMVVLAALAVITTETLVKVITSIVGLLGGVAAVGLHRQGARIEKDLARDFGEGE